MIIDNSYFSGEFYLPQAKPSLVPENSVSDKVWDYINEFSSDCLLRCLGFELFEEFADNLDSDQENGLKDTSDEKWNYLLNGHSYEVEGVKKKWKGLVYKEIGTSKKKSLIVSYVFFHFQFQNQQTSTSTGDKKVRAKNSEVANASPTLSSAWNKFVNQAQPGCLEPTILHSFGAIGVDYYNQNKRGYSTLKDFIEDMNILDEENYKGYSPEIFVKMNAFGI